MESKFFCITFLQLFVPFSLAAKKLIQALQDSEGDPDSIEDSKSTETKQEIIQLGCQYGNPHC